jgi:hypothetical protein
VIGSQWVQTPRHCDPITCLVGIGAECLATSERRRGRGSIKNESREREREGEKERERESARAAQQAGTVILPQCPPPSGAHAWLHSLDRDGCVGHELEVVARRVVGVLPVTVACTVVRVSSPIVTAVPCVARVQQARCSAGRQAGRRGREREPAGRTHSHESVELVVLLLRDLRRGLGPERLHGVGALSLQHHAPRVTTLPARSPALAAAMRYGCGWR